MIMKEEAYSSPSASGEPAVLKERIELLERELAAALADRAAIMEKQGKLVHILENISDVVFMVDHRGVLTYVSPGVKDIWGYGEEELVGKNFLDFVHPGDRHILALRFLELGTGVEYPMIYRMKNKAGTFRWVRTRTRPRMEKGTLVDAVGTLIDITDQDKIINTLQKSEEKYRNILESIQEGYFEVDLAGNLTFFNPALCSIIGYHREELAGMNNRRFMDPENAQNVFRAFREVYLTGVPRQTLECRIVQKGGAVRHLEVSVALVTDPGGKPAGFRGIARDVTERINAERELNIYRRHLEELITERTEELEAVNSQLMIKISQHKEMEEALRESEARFRDIADLSPVVIFETDGGFRLTYANHRARDLFGYSRDDLEAGIDGWMIIAEEDHQRVMENFRRRLQGEDIGLQEYRGRRKDGSTFPILLQSVPVLGEGKIIGTRGIVIDITERKQVEGQTKEMLNFLQTLIDTIPSPIFCKDIHGRYLDCNREFEAYTGLKKEEIIGRRAQELFPPEIAHKYQEMDQILFRNPGRQIYEHPIVYADGNTHDVVVNKATYNGADGSPAGLVGVMVDITDRKRAERSLHMSEEKFRLLAENSTDVIWTMSLDGRFTYVSPSVTMQAGYTQEEAMTMTIESYIYKEDLPWVLELLAEELQKPRGERSERRTLELRQNKKDGSLLDVEVSVSWLYDEEGEIVGLQGSTRDIPARKEAEATRKQLEERLIQAQKLESIGTLAGGIAHDFNNLLMGIQGYASLMLRDLPPGHPHYEKLRAIEKQVASGADLTRQLLGVARGGRYEVKPADMNEIIANAAAMFGRTKKEIHIHEKYAPGLRPVEVDRGQMDQVLLNLFVNAWQAMPGGGDLFLETENVHLDTAFVTPHELPPGPYVRIVVTDTGVGMDENTRRRIFDPFFTTRQMGRGAGLGLAMVYGIVKGHGGMIHVDSAPGQGATFSIFLPASEKTPEQEATKTTGMMRGTEGILLVDDEQVILDIGREMLESLGYRVYLAGSGAEALAVYREKGRAIALVILDMIMPGMSGGETFDRLREAAPDIRVLLSSGYSLDGQARQIMDRGCDGFLQKPFRMEDLSRKVREVLEKEKAGQ